MANRKKKDNNRKELILEAAERVVSKSGIQGATLRGIADEAGISTGAIYYYFSSKEEILYALMDSSLSESTRIAYVARGGLKETDDLLKEISENVGKRFRKNADNRVQFYLAQEAIMGDNELADRFKMKYSEWIGRTEELLGFLYKREKTRYDTAVASLLIGAIDGVVLQLLMKANPASLNDIIKVYDLLIHEGIPCFLDKVREMEKKEGIQAE